MAVIASIGTSGYNCFSWDKLIKIGGSHLDSTIDAHFDGLTLGLNKKIEEKKEKEAV